MRGAKVLGAWLRARRWMLLYALLFCGCFWVVYGLYGYPAGVAGYATLLGAVLGLGFALPDFARFYAAHRRLQQVAGRFPTGQLPPAQHLLHEDWVQVVEALEEERRRLERENEVARRDAEEYYTLWAHQIKTPLSALRLLVQRGGTPAELDWEAHRIEQYVGMVLQYQRLASLNSDLRLEPVRLDALAREAGRAAAPLFIHRGLSLTVEESSAEVVADKKWLLFVLEQLYTNAVKYTDTGGVNVYWLPAEETLVVEDSGRGIAADDLPRVFERGFTGAAGREERSSTGIGLYLCREIMGRLGFGIRLESTPGKGTRALLHLRQQALDIE